MIVRVEENMYVTQSIQRDYRVRVQTLPFQRAGLQGGAPGLPESERVHKVKVSSWKVPGSHCAPTVLYVVSRLWVSSCSFPSQPSRSHTGCSDEPRTPGMQGKPPTAELHPSPHYDTSSCVLSALLTLLRVPLRLVLFLINPALCPDRGGVCRRKDGEPEDNVKA